MFKVYCYAVSKYCYFILSAYKFLFVIISTYLPTAVPMHFLFTNLISFNNVFFDLRTNKHNIITANCDLDNTFTKMYTYFVVLYVMYVEKNVHRFRENYFCKHLHAFRHDTMAYIIIIIMIIIISQNVQNQIIMNQFISPVKR